MVILNLLRTVTSSGHMLDHHTILSLAFAQRIDLGVGMLFGKWCSLLEGESLSWEFGSGAPEEK